MSCTIKGTGPPPKKKFLYWPDRNENLYIYVKLKNKWDKYHILFPIFPIEIELFTENWKKGGPEKMLLLTNGLTYRVNIHIN